MNIRAAPLDMAASAPHIREAARAYAPLVDLRVSQDDGMLARHVEGGDVDYLIVGSSALSTILAALHLGGQGTPARILDFGCGAGRVTRWLKVAFPSSHLACSDLRPHDIAFCSEVFGVEVWISGTDVEAIDFRGPHDLIWMGSVLTHLDERTSKRLVERAMGALTPGGMLVATTLGRAARAIQDANPIYLEGEGWTTVKRGYDKCGYGYMDYDGECGYGLSLSSPSWVAELATRRAGWRLVMLSERSWDGTQDVFALQEEPAFPADPGSETEKDREIASLHARIHALETSTSWKITAPLRRLMDAARRSDDSAST